MFIVLAYDVGVKRSAKTRKVAKKYLHSVQRSVFEGNVTEKNLKDLKRDLQRIVDPVEDTVTIYRLPTERYVTRDELGRNEDMDPLFF